MNTTKKNIPFGLIVLLLFIFSSSFSLDAQSVGSPVENGEGKLDIRFSENLETLALLYNLSESGDYLFEHNAEPRAMLARALTARFARFKDHEAVTRLNYLLNNDFVDSYDIVLSMFNSALPDYIQYAEYPPIYYENDSLSPAQVKVVFEDFHESVRQFYLDANLEEFFKYEMKDLYAKLMLEVGTVVPDDAYIELMESYYGIRRNAYTILVSAFSFNGIGRSATVESTEGIYIFQFVSSNPEVESDTVDINNLQSFTVGYIDADYFREIAVHELGHSFFHEALRENESNIELVNELANLFTDSLNFNMRRQGYVDWPMCFEEHLVRLGELKIAEQMGHHEFAARYKEECIIDRGFIYLEMLNELFEEYESNRAKYASVDDFIPILIERMKGKLPQNK